jgi:hypothetical protein
MRKFDSKRRWIARASLGQFIPDFATHHHRGLGQRLILMGAVYSDLLQFWRLRDGGTRQWAYWKRRLCQ